MSQGCFQILSLVFKLVNFIFQLIISPLLCPFSLKTLEAPEKHLNCGKKKINLMIRWSAAFQQCYDELAIHNTLHTWYVLIIIELRKSPTYNFHSLNIYLLSVFFLSFFLRRRYLVKGWYCCCCSCWYFETSWMTQFTKGKEIRIKFNAENTLNQQPSSDKYFIDVTHIRT